ncbi:MAG: glycosyltransferase family 39 protein [Anaerolineales bacterium]
MKKQTLSTDDIAVLILFSAIIFGTWLRIMPVWMAGFPINDGGMFYTMIQDLQANHYTLPLLTTYNQLSIPYVYPPLGFYIGAAITNLLKLSSPLSVVQWLPGILNAFCIPAFYMLAKEISANKLQSAVSTLVFAFIPHLTAWFSMGGGLTRSLGAFFMLLAITNIHRVFANNSNKDIWGAIIFSSLGALSHTEAPIYTIAIAVYVWAMKSHSIEGIKKGLLISMGVLICTSPWLIWINNNHGLAPLISAGQTSFRSIWSILKLLNIDLLTEEPYLDILGAIGILGMAFLVTRKNFFLPGMIVVIFLSHPRSAHTIGNIPLAMAAGYFVTDVLLPSITSSQVNPANRNKIKQYTLPIFFAILIPYVISNSLYYEITLSQKHVSESDKNAMAWVEENTAKESKFLVITGETNGLCDSTSEWFPALAKRQSLGTLQGNEWLKGKEFTQFAGNIQTVQACSGVGFDCIMMQSKPFAKDFDYLYVSLSSPTVNCELTNASTVPRSLVHDIKDSSTLQVVFSSDDVVIFGPK